MGSTAATLLLEVIAAGNTKAEVKHVTLKPELVVRRSTRGWSEFGADALVTRVEPAGGDDLAALPPGHIPRVCQVFDDEEAAPRGVVRGRDGRRGPPAGVIDHDEIEASLR